MTTLALTDFLLARIAEDEAEGSRMVLHDPLDCPVCGVAVEEFIMPFRGRTEYRRERCEPCGHELTPEQADGCWVSTTPARVLAECEAKRRIVEAYVYLVADPELRAHAWTFALQCLALPYADHPDYRQEWKP